MKFTILTTVASVSLRSSDSFLLARAWRCFIQ
uniref:Uncharacterized protein n=1 Tax=Anguilla anguilla TaxID=7936 RepID=A0A0E9QHY1_ANGAN